MSERRRERSQITKRGKNEELQKQSGNCYAACAFISLSMIIT